MTTISPCRAPLLVLLAWVLLQPLLAAQEQEPAENAFEDLDELSLEELMEVEVETVYSASKQVQKTTEAPSSVTIVTAEDIQRFGYRNLAEVLEGVRGFYLTEDRNYARLGVRGFSPPGDYTTRILLMINGHRVNDPVYSSAATGNEFPLDVDLIERVEIIRGPGSSLYGSNAFLGVINVIVRRGASIDGVEIEAGAGTHGSMQARLSAGAEQENGPDILVSVSGAESEGGSLFYPEFADTSSDGWTDGTDGEESRSFFASASDGDWRFFAAHSARDKEIPTGAYGTVFDAEGSETLDVYTLLDLAWEKKFDGPYSLLARVFYDSFDYSGDYLYDYEDDGPPFTTNRDIGQGSRYGAEAQVTWTGSEDHRVTSGLEVSRLSGLEQRNLDEGGEVFLDDEREGTLWGLFVQDEIALSHSLALTAGIRHDQDYSFGGTTNPRLALVWAATESATFKGLYGRAFRAPNTYELYYEDASTAKQSSDLDPETIETFELVWEQRIREGYKSSLSLYHYDIDDLIVQVVDPGDGLLVFVNQDRVEANGVEVEVNGQTESGLRGGLSYAYQRVRDETTDDAIPNSPEHLAQLHFSAPILRSSWQAGIEVLFAGDRLTLAGAEAEDSLVTNLTLLRKEILHGVDFSVSIRNLFDTEYAHPGSGEHLQDTIEQDGRTFFVSLRGRF